MKNKNTINALLEYRFKTKLIADLLEENFYFDTNVSLNEASKIFKNTLNQVTLICENELPLPKHLLKKRILNEQVPPARLARALEWTKGYRMAKEFEAAKAAEAKAAEEARLRAATEPQNIEIPIAAVTKGITPSQQEGLGKATIELLSTEALRRAKPTMNPEDLAKELRDEMTSRWLQLGNQNDPRLLELQQKMEAYIDFVSPAAIETARTMQFGTEPLPKGGEMDLRLKNLLNPKYGPERELAFTKDIPREDLAFEWWLAHEEKPKLEKKLEKEKEFGKALVRGAYYTGGEVGEVEPIIDVFGQPKTTYKQEVIKSPESVQTEQERLAQEGTPKTKSWLEDINAVMDELRAEYSRRKMEGKITTPEERTAGEQLKQKTKEALEIAQRPKLEDSSKLQPETEIEKQKRLEREQEAFLRTVIPPGSIVR